MKNFLRIYFGVSILYLMVFIPLVFTNDFEITYNIWKQYAIYNPYVSILFITSAPVVISLLFLLIAKVCTYKTPFIRWNRKSLFIDGGILLLFIGFASCVLYLFGVYRHEFNPLMEKEIHHVVITLVVAFMTGLLVIFLKDGMVRLKKEMEQKDKINPDSINKGFASGYLSIYYIFTLLLAVLYGSLTLAFNIFEYKCVDAAMLIFSHTLFFIIGSVLSALGAYLSEKLESFSRFISQLISIATILIFLAATGFALWVNYETLEDSDTFKGFTFTSTTNSEIGYDEEDAEDEEEYYHDWYEGKDDEEEQEEEIPYDGLIRETSLAYLWEDYSDHQDSIHAALNFMENRIDSRDIWTELEYLHADPDEEDTDSWTKSRFAKFGGLAYHRIANHIYNFRKDIHLPGILEAHIRFITLHISPETYDEKYRQVVNLLLSTYEELLEDDADYSQFEKVYEKMSYYPQKYMDYDEHQAFRYAQLDSFTYISQKEKLYTFSYDYKPDKTFGSWGYSFWGRRYNEGIHKDVYYILQRINSKFPEI